AQSRNGVYPSNRIIMKIYSSNYRCVLVATMLTCLLSFGHYAAGKPLASEKATATESVNDPANLIIRRIPNLGNNVVVDVYLDGKPFAAIGYGHTFKGSLPAGKHVLSVLATPRPRWPAQQG